MHNIFIFITNSLGDECFKKYFVFLYIKSEVGGIIPVQIPSYSIIIQKSRISNTIIDFFPESISVFLRRVVQWILAVP